MRILFLRMLVTAALKPTSDTPKLSGVATNLAQLARQGSRHPRHAVTIVIATGVVKSQTAKLFFHLLSHHLGTAFSDQVGHAVQQRVPSVAAGKSPAHQGCLWITPPALIQVRIVITKGLIE
jgi:hypothetical protein